MAWAALTAAEIKTRLSGPEASALQTRALEAGQPDPLPDVIAQATDEVRSYIAGNGSNKLGPAGTLPPQVRAQAIAIVRWYLAGRLAVGTNPTLMQGESRRKEYEAAIKFLEDVAAGKNAVEQPDVTGPETFTTSASFGSDTPLDFTQ